LTTVRYLHPTWPQAFRKRDAAMIWLACALELLRDDMYHEGWENEADVVGDLFALVDDYLTNTVV
jgi:hypothetical protein